MVEDVYSKKAKQYESEAHYEEMKGARKSPAKIIESWRKAGEYWNRTKNLPKAEMAYDNALKHARRYLGGEEIKEIEKERASITAERKKLLHGLERIKGGLEKKFLGFSSVFALTLALFFVSSNLTGNAVGNIGVADTKWLAICFFLCGSFFAFIYLRGKNKK
ncbi:MAG: hypothetical protein M1416_00480 [Candidatus Pacearchaeota archaeon]|nr:hypothetical protein [Candidatus Pacearchaeota archaeon]